MKIIKTITIDAELNEKLKEEPNASGLISKLLQDYYEEGGAMKKKELEALVSHKKIEIKKLNDEIQIIVNKVIDMNKRKKILSKALDKVPQDVQDDLEFFPKLSLEAFKSRYEEIYSGAFPKLMWAECEEAYNKYHGSEN